MELKDAVVQSLFVATFSAPTAADWTELFAIKKPFVAKKMQRLEEEHVKERRKMEEDRVALKRKANWPMPL